MASVKAPPFTYEPKLRSNIFNENLLSRPQLETVAYACQAHALMLPDKIRRKGFYLGDGAGIDLVHNSIMHFLWISSTLPLKLL